MITTCRAAISAVPGAVSSILSPVPMGIKEWIGEYYHQGGTEIFYGPSGIVQDHTGS